MKQATIKKKAGRKPLSINFQHRLKEVILIVTGSIAAFLLIALATYHQTDPGWSKTGSGQTVLNASGKAGAWFADLILYIFGYPAYLFPLLLFYGAWSLFIRRKIDKDFYWPVFVLRTFGFLLILLSCSGLASLHLQSNAHQLPFSAGGILGELLGPGLEPAFNTWGTSLLLLALLLSGVTLFTGLSWLGTMDALGYSVLISAAYALKTWKKVLQKFEIRGIFRKSNIPREKSASLKEDSPRFPHKKRELPIRKPKPLLSPAADESAKAAPMSNEKVIFKGTAEGLPDINLLEVPTDSTKKGYSAAYLEKLSEDVENRLLDFGLKVEVVAVNPGPVITRFELSLAPGTKVSKLSGLAKDLARSLSVVSVRVVDVIPGKNVVGVEIPNEDREIVRLSEVIASKQYEQSPSVLSMALGKDIAGYPVVVDLAKMPHLLVAGTTGSGKSVGVNAMLLSLLYKATPDEVRLILIDPKMLELAIYEGIPHLLTPVVTDMKEAANALRWSVVEMERRYKLMAALGVRSLASFNKKVKEAIGKGHPLTDPLWQPQPGDTQPATLEPLPCIVIVIDEFADMMMVVGKKVEQLIARIAQKARAAGIHLILATQRPSVDVITGLIKANVPTRIAFQVSSKIDSRTVIDQAGAEQLLGHGDMLYLPPGTGVPVRLHGAYVADEEVHSVVKDLHSRGEPNYIDSITAPLGVGSGQDGGSDSEGEGDPLYDEAVKIVTETRRASISSVQRRLKIGYNRAARLVEQMETSGVVGPMESNGSREVLAPPPPKD